MYSAIYNKGTNNIASLADHLYWYGTTPLCRKVAAQQCARMNEELGATLYEVRACEWESISGTIYNNF